MLAQQKTWQDDWKQRFLSPSPQPQVDMRWKCLSCSFKTLFEGGAKAHSEENRRAYGDGCSRRGVG